MMCGDDSLLFENLKKSIRDIVQCNDSEKLKISFKLKDAQTLLTSLHVLEAFDVPTAQNEIKFLQEASECLLTNEVAGKFFVITHKILTQIFLQTTERFRQSYFHELMKVYFQEFLLESNCKFESHIKVLLPLVKLNILEGNIDEMKAKLVTNIVNFFENPRMNQEDIYLIVKNQLKTTEFNLLSYNFIPLDQRNGHLGDYFQLKIKVKHNGEVKLLEMFVKFLNANMDFFKQILARGPSKKEEFFYFEYISKLKKFGLSELIDFAPQCYFSRVDDVLVLDDMSVKGYVGLTPNHKLNLDTLKLTIGELAKLHACSFIFEEALSKKGETNFYDLYSEYLQEVFFVRDSKESEHAFERIVNVIVYLGGIFSDITGKYSQEELRQKALNLYKYAFALIPKSDRFINVLCHGDVYVANMLFNFNKEQACKDVKLIDFQILRYKPPTHDILFFLYQNAFKETLDQHMDDLLELYYKALAEHLNKFNLDINKVYPKEDFHASMKSMKVLAVFMSINYSYLTTIDPKVREKVVQENQVELLRDEYYLINLGLKDEHYRTVMKGLITSFIELCDSNDI